VGEKPRELGSDAFPQVSILLYHRQLLSDHMRKDVQVLPEQMTDGDSISVVAAGKGDTQFTAAGLCRPRHLDA
jgi:hypothetical protein